MPRHSSQGVLGFCEDLDHRLFGEFAQDGDHRLIFARASMLGFSSVELQILVDWLASPEFPRGLHTFLAPREFVKDRTRPRP